MTLEQLTILNTVVQEGSFRAAADKLWKTQPAISISIAKLEEELSLQIFERGHRKTVLTDAGKPIWWLDPDVVDGESRSPPPFPTTTTTGWKNRKTKAENE